MNERTKSRFELIVTLYGRYKNLEHETMKKQEKANNNLSYRY